MNDRIQNSSDTALETTIGNLLRYGVLISAVIVLIGGILLLIKNGMLTPHYDEFRLVPLSLRGIGGIMAQAFLLQPQGLIQFGLLLLIATPIARVLFSVFAFFRQRDYLYTAITLLVFLILMFSLFVKHI